ncbi:MAG: BlaI/MecI/CopY family transcriptional regulator [Methanobacteriota archaeon]
MPQLGDLEFAVLQVLGDLGEARPGEIHRALNRERAVAYTTVTNTLYRLLEKGLVRARRGKGTRTRYRLDAAGRPYQTVLRASVERLVDAFGASAVSGVLGPPAPRRRRKRGR